MAFGLSSTGFNAKRLQDIKLDIENDLKAKFGEIDTSADSVFGQIIGVISSHLTQLWEQSDFVYQSFRPSSAEGVQLDDIASISAITRLAATESKAVIQVQGDLAATLPISTQVSQSVTNNKFTTDTAVTITDSNLHKAELSFTVANSETYSLDINGITISYTSDASATEEEIKLGLTTAINGNTTLAAVLISTFSTTEPKITISTLDYTKEDSIFTLENLLELNVDNRWSPVSITAVVKGKIAIPYLSITTIDNPASGISAVINYADGIPGRDLELDDAFRIRRRQSLGMISASTVAAIVSRIKQDIPEVSAAFAFENTTDTPVNGIPAHAFELIVAASSSVDQDIADLLWQIKPAGIATHGTTSVDVIDSNGDNQIIKFSHSVTKYVHIELTYTTTGADGKFQVNGEEAIIAELVRLGSLYTFGSDILVQPLANAGFIAGGVYTTSVRVAITDDPEDTPTYVTTNIKINPADYPSVDSARITLIKV